MRHEIGFSNRYFNTMLSKVYDVKGPLMSTLECLLLLSSKPGKADLVSKNWPSLETKLALCSASNRQSEVKDPNANSCII